MEVIKELGLVQVYTGKGKGKTTASLGLALRAVGHGFRVHMVQFMKGRSYAGELQTAKILSPLFTITQFGKSCSTSSLIQQGYKKCSRCGDCFVRDRGINSEDKQFADKAMEHAWRFIHNRGCDILILDEIGNALRYNLVSPQQVLQMIAEKPKDMELILTGRGIPEEVMAAADLVTEMTEIKHPLKNGIPSRRGIEY